VNGEVAQLVAVVAHGNNFLVRGGDPPELFPGNTTFMYVGEVEFAGHADGTAPWFERLRAAGARRLWLHLPESNRMLSGFVGGMHPALWADGQSRSLWIPSWQVRDRKDRDRRIWAVAYGELPLVAPPPRAAQVLDLATELDDALAAADEIAHRNDYLEHFAHWFVGARSQLHSDEPVFEHLTDLVPSDWDLEARRLLAASERAWVFGAMRSWNDIGFEDKELERDYKAVSARLYAAIRAAVEAGANAPVPDV